MERAGHAVHTHVIQGPSALKEEDYQYVNVPGVLQNSIQSADQMESRMETNVNSDLRPVNTCATLLYFTEEIAMAVRTRNANSLRRVKSIQMEKRSASVLQTVLTVVDQFVGLMASHTKMIVS